MAVDKPAGVPAQPTLTSDRGTLPELVSALLGEPVTLVHRLDRETSGVTVLARTRAAAAALSEAFRVGGPEKTYLALCARAPSPAEGRLEAAIGKDPRRPGLRQVSPGGDIQGEVSRRNARLPEAAERLQRHLTAILSAIATSPEAARTALEQARHAREELF